jgi:hypothetical protein
MCGTHAHAQSLGSEVCGSGFSRRRHAHAQLPGMTPPHASECACSDWGLAGAHAQAPVPSFPDSIATACSGCAALLAAEAQARCWCGCWWRPRPCGCGRWPELSLCAGGAALRVGVLLADWGGGWFISELSSALQPSRGFSLTAQE